MEGKTNGMRGQSGDGEIWQGGVRGGDVGGGGLRFQKLEIRILRGL